MTGNLLQDQWRPEEPLRLGTERFGLKLVARLAGCDRLGVELGADPTRGDLAAIKHASVGDSLDPDAVDRLEREHAVLRSVDHPTIRQSFGLRRERHGLRTKSVGLLLAFVDGSSLDRWEIPELPVLCQVMSVACRGLAHLHERGLVHGDLRPRHIIVDDRARPSIISFGRTIRAGHRFDPEIQGHAYSAPEWIDGGIATPRADVFGMASTIGAVLSRTPLEPCCPHESQRERRARHARWGEVLNDAGVHAPLQRLLLKAMDPDPTRRPAFIESFGSRLMHLADTLSCRKSAA